MKVEEASVCVVRDGGDLEVRASGLRPASTVLFSSPLFGPNEIPVSSDGDFENEHFFASREPLFEGVVAVSALTADGARLDGDLTFD